MAEEKKNDETQDEEPLTPTEAPKDADAKKDAHKGRSPKKMLLIIVPLVLAIIAAVCFFFFVIKAPKTEEVKEQPDNHGQEVALNSNTYFDIDPIIVGLAPSGPKREFLKLDITLRVASEIESNAISNKLPMIKDSLIVFLRSLRSSDFNSSSSSIYLKEEITKRINKIISPIKVKEVLFQEITVN